MTNSERIRVTEQSLSRQLDWIRSADSKTGFVSSVALAMVGAIAFQVPEQPESLKLVLLFAILGGGLPVASLISCGLATFPRVAFPKSSLLFFGSIAAFTAEEFAQSMASVDSDSYIRDLTYQIYRNAEIASRKFYYVRAASFFLFAGTLPWILFGIYAMELI